MNALVAALALAAAIQQARPNPLHVAVARVLDGLTAREPLAADECLSQLATLGVDAPGLLVQSLESGQWPNCARCAKGNCPHRSDASREAARSSLRKLTEAARRALAGQAMASPERRAALEPALRVLAATGNASDLKLALPAAESSPELALAAGAMVEGVMQRDPTALPEVSRALPRASAPAQAILLYALGSVPTPRSAQALTEILGRDPKLDPLVLAQLGRLAAARRGLVVSAALPRIRASLQSTDPSTKREAALALGRVGDDGAVTSLIPLLEDPSSGVRENTVWALQKITCLHFGSDVERWKRWSEGEAEWWARRQPECAARLESGNAQEAIAAIREMSQHRLDRQALATVLLPSLHRTETPVVLTACAALGSLKAPSSVPALVALLEENRWDVRMAAWNALKAITGEDRPLDANAWRALSAL